MKAHLLKSIYKIAHDTHVKDVTVEDASPDFSRVRDFVDVQYLVNNIPFFQKNPMKPLDKKAIDTLREETKLCAVSYFPSLTYLIYKGTIEVLLRSY